jgi:hypothetical protein
MPPLGDRTEELGERLDPNDSPFSVPPIEGIPFAKDSQEAEAIRRILKSPGPEASARPGRPAGS